MTTAIDFGGAAGGTDAPIVTVFFDAATWPNPDGTGAFGFVIRFPSGQEFANAGHIPAAPGVTNNTSEWTALDAALEMLLGFKLKTREPDVTGVLILGDSKLVINQLNGSWACNAPALRTLRDSCLKHLDAIGLTWRADWVPRELNARADELASAAYRAATGRDLPGPGEYARAYRRGS